MWFVLLLLQDGFTYVPRDTREESRRASIDAMAAAVRQSGWKFVGPYSADSIPPLKQIDRSKARDAKWVRDDTGDLDMSVFGRSSPTGIYLFRTLDADRDTAVSAEIRNGGPMEVFVNGELVEQVSDGVRHRISLPLKRGANELALKIAQKHKGWPFFYRVLPLSAELLKKLDERLDQEFPSTVEQNYTRIETIELPKDAVMEIGGLAFDPDGRLFACTRRGEVWMRHENQWSRFASGLHEPLGICAIGPSDVIVGQRPELTRLRDTDKDGRADRFDTICDAYGLSGNYHEFAYGPVRDKEGNLYGTLNVGWESSGVSKAPYRGWAYKVTPQGEFVPIAPGLRSPAGIGLSPDGELFVTDNQGDWMGTSPLFHITPGSFYGHPASLRWEKDYAGPKDATQLPLDQLSKRRKPPAASFVHGPLGHSPGEPVWIPSGPFKGQILVGDQTRSLMTRIALEKVGGEYQGAVFPFRSGFASGLIRLAFAPDGSLWIGQTDRGWGSVGGRPFSLQRLVWTGKIPMEIVRMSATQNGFELTFTKPVKDAGEISLQHYYYRYHRQYGSPQIDPTPVKPESVSVSGDRVSIVLPEIVEGRIYELHLKGLRATDGDHLLHPSAYYTLNRKP
jgi:hypothetical protein